MCKHSRLVTQKDRSPSGKALTQVTPAAHAPQVSMVRNCRHPSGSMKKAEFPLLRCRTFRALGTTQQLLTQARAALPGKTPSSLATARSWRMSFSALAHTTDTASPEGSIHGAERNGAEHSPAEPSRAEPSHLWGALIGRRTFFQRLQPIVSWPAPRKAP